ncbi:MAG: cold shock protein [Solirubrobacteraceae bacterium]|nr:cold shock protein [Solirubrobacteraceae bacterium]
MRWYDGEKGCGRITADDDEVLFVHLSGIVGEGLRSLNEGDRVSFTWRGGIVDHGRHVAESARKES